MTAAIWPRSHQAMSEEEQALAVTLFSEILTAEQLVRNRLGKVLPKGMEISHFSVLNYLARTREERTPAQLARVFHLTKGAMTNTLRKLEVAGYIHIRPDWDDARRKMVAISPAGTGARDAALLAITPMIQELIGEMGAANVRATLPILRELRTKLSDS